MTNVRLPRTIVNQILHHAQIHEHDEVCGLVGARKGKANSLYQVKNIARDPAHLYQMDPSQQIDAMRQMRENGEDLYAIYHSHPTSIAQPSAIDVRDAAYPDAFYLIVSLNTTGVLELRAFCLRDHQVRECELELEEEN